MTMAVVTGLVLIGLAQWSGPMPIYPRMVAVATGLEQLSWRDRQPCRSLSVGVLWNQLVV